MTLVSKDYTNVTLEPSSECFDESTVKEQAKQVTQVAVAEQQNSIGETKKVSEFQQAAKTFSSHSFGHQVRQNPSIKNGG